MGRKDKEKTPDVHPYGEDRDEKDYPDLFVVIDKESNALEYGPSPDKDAAIAHANKMRAQDMRGELASTVKRNLLVYKLTEVKSKGHDTADILRVPTDRVDRWDRTSAANAGEPGTDPVPGTPPKDK